MRNTIVKADFMGESRDAQILGLLIDFSDRIDEMKEFCDKRKMQIDWQRMVQSLTLHYGFMIEVLVNEMCANGVDVQGLTKKHHAQIYRAYVVFNEKTHASAVVVSVVSPMIESAVLAGDLPSMNCGNPACKECATHQNIVFAAREGLTGGYDEYEALPIEHWSISAVKRVEGALLC